MTLDEFLEDALVMPLDEARMYMKDFPQMGLKIDSEKKSNQIMYILKWSDDARNALHQLQPQNRSAEISIPLKLDIEEHQRYKDMVRQNQDRAFTIREEMAKNRVPSGKVIDNLLACLEAIRPIWSHSNIS